MEISEEVQDVLKEIINNGIGRASASLSKLLGTFITLKTPEISIFTMEQIQQYLSEQIPDHFVMVVQNMEGAITGRGIVSFPLIEGKTLVDLLLENPESPTSEFGVMEVEAIGEVGNMVISAVGSAISDLTNILVNYQLPDVLFTEQVIPLEESSPENIYCFAKTFFTIEKIHAEGFINLIFSYANAEMLVKQATM